MTIDKKELKNCKETSWKVKGKTSIEEIILSHFFSIEMAVTKAKKKDIKVVSGVLHVHTTPNNTLVTLIDQEGNKVLGGGTGKVGYKGSKKSTPYAAEVLTKQILKDAQNYGLKEI